MESPSVSRNFASDLRVLAQQLASSSTSNKECFVKNDDVQSDGINLQTEILALAGFDQPSIQNPNSQLNTFLRGYFKVCDKYAPQNYKASLAFFGGFGMLFFRFSEPHMSINNFKRIPEVQKRFSEVSTLLGSISTDLIGNLLHHLQKVIVVLVANPYVCKTALLALIRRSWIEVGGSQTEGTDFHFDIPGGCNFGVTEANSIIEFFSVTSAASIEAGDVPHMDAIEIAMRRNVEASIQQNQLIKTVENGHFKPDEWTQLKGFLDPVSKDLKMGIKQVVEMVFNVLQSNRSNDSIQSELIDMMGFGQFDFVAALIRDRAEWLQWYKQYISSSNSLRAGNGTGSTCSTTTKHGGKVFKNSNRDSSTKDGNNLVEQLVKDPSVLEDARKADLLAAAQHAHLTAHEVYHRSVAFEATQQSQAESFPFVFDAMAELMATRPIKDRSKMVLPLGTEHKITDRWESYDFAMSLNTADENPAMRLVQKLLPNNGTLVEVASLDRIAQLAFKGVHRLNLVQSVVFETAYNSSENLLISAPTGAGKTNTALLTILHVIRQHIDPQTSVLQTGNFKIVYVAPMKALAAEMTATFGKRLEPLGVRVKECTGDMQLSTQEILETQMLVTTPEKWDVISRKGSGDASLVQTLQLLIIDEVHLLQEDRGPVIEALVARTLRQVETSQRLIRIVGLSATLPNYFDVAAFLRVNPRRGLFYFDDRFRPVPLGMSFVGVRAPSSGGSGGLADQLMSLACYERVIEQLRQDQQVMVFVHSRSETVRTGRWLLTEANQRGDSKHFEIPPSFNTPQHSKQMARISDQGLRELAPRGVGCHHAGMIRPDRNLVERLFAEGALRVLVCTATLAWGVNLPAHAVIIKGTRIYNPDRCDYVDLDVLNVLQIFGRAGRPQFDRFGLATIITTQDKLERYVRLITNQVSIDSKLLNSLNDHLNAEVALGTVSNVSEAVIWLSYTFLFVRITKSPLKYGITPKELMEDPDLMHFLTKVVEDAAKALDNAEMIRFEPSTGQMASTDRGRIASLYYISYTTADLVRERLHPTMLLQDLLGLVADAKEFAQMRVRDEEEADLTRLLDNACHILVKNPGTVEATVGVKINVLLQAHISRLRPTTHSLISDMYYVEQNAGRLARYVFEIALRRAWAVCATSAHRLTKMIENRLWYDETPLWQFIGSNVENCQILERVDDLSLHVDKIRELNPSELNGILRYQGLRGAEYVCRLASYLPFLAITVDAQPITRSILRITVRLTADFTWSGSDALPYWVWVEDPSDTCIYHSEAFTLTKEMMIKAKGKPLTELIFTIPVHEPVPSQYLIRCISDRYLGVETVASVQLRNLLFPQADPPHTDLLTLDPLPVEALNNRNYEALFSFTHFNPIQTQVFHTLYHQDVNVLLGAPTGSGKTAVAELAMFRVFNTSPEKKCVYIAPLKALVRERVDDWSVKIGNKLKKRVVELTGDISPDTNLLRNADVIVATPEKWDGVSRSWRQRDYVRQIALIVIDEIHMVGEDRGPILEAIVSRANFIANQLNTRVRVVGLSTALANAVDMAVWLRVPLTSESSFRGRGLFNFRPSIRPVPLEVHIQAFPGRHYCPRMALMNKPIFQAIQSHSANKPVLIFVASRRQTRRTAFDLISYASSDFSPRRWVNMDVNEMEALASTIRDQNLQLTLPYGIGIHHAGLQDKDRRIVEELFVNQKIQVLIATSTLAWGVNFPAHLVIVKGTEYFDGKTKRYVDYPITDVLQMIGRAGRPQFDIEGKAVVMVQDTKKAFYKRFLYEPFPVESCLPRILPDYLNAEIASGSITSMQAAMECITWTFYFRRLLINPSYYQLEDTSAPSVSSFLSMVVSDAVEQLIDSRCVEVGEPEEGKEDASVPPIYSTPMGRLASFYYISHKTIHLFASSLSPTTDIEDLIYILSMSDEFTDVPVRHGEDEVNANLAREMPLRLREPPDTGHAKAHLLLQAHLSRMTTQLPVADYVTDLASVLDQTPRLLAALLDCAALSGYLAVALRCILLGQMIARSLWLSDSPLLQLSTSIDSSHLAAFRLGEDVYVETLPQLLERAGAAPHFPGLRNIIKDRLALEIFDQIKRTLQCLPIASVGMSLVGGRSEQKVPIIGLDISAKEARRYPLDVYLGVEYALVVTIRYENTPTHMSQDRGGRQSRPPGWVAVLGEPAGTEVNEGGLLLALKKTTFRKSASRASIVSLSFGFNEVTTAIEGIHELTLYLMSDTFLSIDQQLPFCIRLVHPCEDKCANGMVDDDEEDI